MTCVLKPGARVWSGTRDSEGHRMYKVTFLVRTSTLDGPANVMRTVGLPKYGDTWKVDADLDLWAWCRWDCNVSAVNSKNEPGTLWEAEFTFSTKPPDKTCRNAEKTDPLLEPQKIHGGSVTYHEEVTRDRFGRPLLTSSFEQLRGKSTEFDLTRSTVHVEQNVASLDYFNTMAMVNTVNAFQVWGMPQRCVKLSKFDWDRKFYGTCNVYYTRKFQFDSRADGFDKDALDESTKVLNGHWDGVTGNWVLDNIGGNPPDPRNPKHFIRYKDKKGENSKVILNGFGEPSGTMTASENLYISVQNGNVNKPLDDEDWWVPVADDPTPKKYVDGQFYPYGSLVYAGSPIQVSLCIATNNLGSPLPFGPKWVLIGTGLTSVVNAGDWDAATTYAKGSYVKDTVFVSPGSIHVERYDESDFYFLGIPVSLDGL